MKSLILLLILCAFYSCATRKEPIEYEWGEAKLLYYEMHYRHNQEDQIVAVYIDTKNVTNSIAVSDTIHWKVGQTRNWPIRR